MKLVSLIIDIGTSSVRVSLLDETLSKVDSAVAERTAEICFDVEKEWQSIRCLVRQLTCEHATDCKITGIAVSALVGWVACDREHRALTECMTYMHQCPEQLKEMLGRISADEIYRINGRRPTPELGALKLAMLKKQHREIYDQITSFLTLKDFINLRLTGIDAIDPTSACYSLVFDVNTCGWNKELIEILGIDCKKVPRLLDSTKQLGAILPTVAEDLGVPPRTPVTVGGPDGSTGILGAGGIHPHTAVSVMGTTDVFFAISERKILEHSGSLVTNPHVVPGLWLVGGPMGMSGGTLNWYQKRFLREAYSLKELDVLAALLEPGSSGVRFLPSLAGERTPFWNSQLRGTIAGLEPTSSAEHLHRAVLEANGYTTRRICELCSQSGIDFSEIIAIGGGSKSDVWLQIKADITGKRLSVADVQEATTLGSAILVSLSSGVSLSQIPKLKIRKTLIPNPVNMTKYDPLYDNYLRFYENACNFY